MPHARLLSTALAAAAFVVAASAQNDDCSGAVLLVQGANGPFSTVGATTSTPAWTCGAAGNDRWYLFLAAAPGTLQVNVCGAGFDTALQVLNGAAGCGALVSLGCNDDGCGTASSLSVALPSAGPYYVRVGGFAGQTGTFTLNVNGPTASGVLATNTTLGTGCYRTFASFYQLFLPGSFDLSGTSFTLIPTGSGYVVIAGIATYVPPTAGAAALQLSDDSQVTVPLSMPFAHAGGTTTSLVVCSNGFVSVGLGNGTGFNPQASSFLAAPQTGWWTQHDMNPTGGGGQVKFQEIGSTAYVTWDGVRNFGGSSAADDNTFQLQFDLASGFVSFVYQSMPTTGNGYLVGYSPGGPSLDPGSIDLSTALLGNLDVGVDQRPLTVSATTRPVLGTAWNLNVTNVPSSAPLGVDVFGIGDPGLNDLATIGLPGCGLRSTLDVLLGWVNTGAHSYALPIPAIPSLVGLHVFTTSAMLQPGVNAFGAITANGVDGGIGDL
jgi:hypothetical protein